MDYLSDSYPIGANFAPASDEEKLRRREGAASKIAPLGIYTKCQSNGSTSDFQADRLKRLSRYCLQEIARDLIPKERVSNCLRRRISKDDGVKVMFNPVREKPITPMLSAVVAFGRVLSALLKYQKSGARN